MKSEHVHQQLKYDLVNIIIITLSSNYNLLNTFTSLKGSVLTINKNNYTSNDIITFSYLFAPEGAVQPKIAEE